MVRKLLAIVILSLAVVFLAVPVGASLVPMSFGFPEMVQSHTLTAFEKNVAASTDNEAASVAFPSSTSGVDGVFSAASFPTILQTAAKSDLLTNCKFMNENEFQAFAYPFVSVGCAAIPPMGLF